MSGKSQSMNRKEKHARLSSQNSRAQRKLEKIRQLQHNALLQHAFRMSTDASLKSFSAITQDNVYLRESLLLATKARRARFDEDELVLKEANHQSIPKVYTKRLTRGQKLKDHEMAENEVEESVRQMESEKKRADEEKEKSVRFQTIPTAFIGENSVTTIDEEEKDRISNESQDVVSNSRQSRSRSRLSPRTKRSPTPYVRRTVRLSLSDKEEREGDNDEQNENDGSIANLCRRSTVGVTVDRSRRSFATPRPRSSYSDRTHKDPHIDEAQINDYDLQNIKEALTSGSKWEDTNRNKVKPEQDSQVNIGSGAILGDNDAVLDRPVASKKNENEV